MPERDTVVACAAMGWSKRLALLGLVLGVAGCGGRTINEDDVASGGSCAPGAQVACACPNGSSGVQLCRGDGTFGACSCGGSAGAGGAPSGSSSVGAMSNGVGASTGEGAGGPASSTGSGGSPYLADHYSLEHWVGPQIWSGLTRSTAVDLQDRVYVTDGAAIFVVDDGVPSMYLSHNELTAFDDDAEVIDMDVGPDGNLYILLGDFSPSILVSSAPHSAAVHIDGVADPYSASRMAVESPDRILLVTTFDGMLAVSAGGVTSIYPDEALGGSGCLGEDVAASQDGYVYYLPGCNGTPVLGGKSDGSGLGILGDPDDLGEYYFWMFGGLARNPPGGTVVNLVGTIYHFTIDGVATEVNTTPTLENITDDEGVFHVAPIEVGPSGAIYVITGLDIYRAVPD